MAECKSSAGAHKMRYIRCEATHGAPREGRESVCRPLRLSLQYALPITPVVKFRALPIWVSDSQSGTSQELVFDGAPEEKTSERCEYKTNKLRTHLR